MLYDNAQLVSLYSHAWQQTKNPLYKKVVYETLEFMEREMTSPEGGFYSSLDADSEGEEGKFYVWTKEEIENELGEQAGLFMDYYNVIRSGNWEHGKNILFREQDDVEFAAQHDLEVEVLQKAIAHGKEVLLRARAKRVHPGLDDKILTSWNALMLRGDVNAYRAFGEERFLKAALKNANFLLNNAISEQGVTRNYKPARPARLPKSHEGHEGGYGRPIHGFLDDYAFVISAFIELHQATFDEQWLNQANELAGYTIMHFFDASSGMFFYSHDDHSDLISRKMEVTDNVIPASNSEMAKNLFFLGTLLYNEEYVDMAKQMLTNVQENVHENIYFYSNWGIVEAHFIKQPCEVAIVGNGCAALRSELDKNYLPDVLFLGGKREGDLELLENKLVKGQTTIYVCKDKVCKMPVIKTSVLTVFIF